MFWKRKPRADAVSPVATKPAPPVDPMAWLPDDAALADENTPYVYGPWQPEVVKSATQLYVDCLNEVLQNNMLHASQVDGGFEFILSPDKGLGAFRLEQVVQGLGIRYDRGTYEPTGWLYNEAQQCMPSYRNRLESHHRKNDRYRRGGDDYYFEMMYYHRMNPYGYQNRLFHNIGVSDFDETCKACITQVTEKLTEAHVQVTPANIVTYLILMNPQTIELAPDIYAGDPRPTQVSVSGYGSSKHENHDPYIPQLYFEYMRSNLPVSYLLAAFMPVFHKDRYSSYNASEHAPRFNIVDVYGMREHPTSLVLEMVGATRAALIENAR